MPSTLAATEPHSLKAEKTTLGALLLDSDAMMDVAPLLKAGDFYDPTYRDIYAAIERLYEDRTPIDFTTVSIALEGNQKVQAIGGSAFLAELVTSVPTSSHVKQYAEIVREKSLRRKLARLGTSMMQLAVADDATSADMLDTAEKEILNLSRHSTESKAVQLSDMRDERFEHYATAYENPDTLSGVTLGFPTIDSVLTGLEPGHLMILAGRPSMGKTALALNFAQNVTEQGKSVTLFSLEMTKEQLFDRTFAGILGVEMERLRRGGFTNQEFGRMGEAMDKLEDARFFVDDDTDRTLVNLRSKARRQQLEHGLDLLIVDYLQLIEVTGQAAKENRIQQITTISKDLKNLARELHCPVIALSQLSRAPEQRTPPIPILSDLRESGAIEQDADSVLMLYREGYYNEDCDDPDLTDVYVRKNRHGPTGRVELQFDRERMQFHTNPS